MDDDLPYLTAEEQLLESWRAHLDSLPRSETLVACQLHALLLLIRSTRYNIRAISRYGCSVGGSKWHPCSSLKLMQSRRLSSSIS